ncbi:MAG: hypothetical protein ABEJ74_08800 [Haloferacaceae archaeon]
MVSARSVVLGTDSTPARWSTDVLVALGLFVLVWIAYAVGAFAISGGVVFLAWDAAVVGVAAATVLAARSHGLAASWLTVYASLLGYNADHYLLGLSHRPLGYRVAAFLQPDGLGFVAVEALVLGTLAWAVGRGVALAVEVARTRSSPDPSE